MQADTDCIFQYCKQIYNTHVAQQRLKSAIKAVMQVQECNTFLAL